MSIRLGRQHPITYTEVLKKELAGIVSDFVSGYIENYETGDPYPYKAMVFFKGVNGEVSVDITKDEFRYLPTKPFDKNDWL